MIFLYFSKFVIKDAIFGAGLLGLGVLASIAEHDYESNSSKIGDYKYIFGIIINNENNENNGNKEISPNPGAYITAATAAFIVGVLYAIHAGFVIKKLLCKKQN